MYETLKKLSQKTTMDYEGFTGRVLILEKPNSVIPIKFELFSMLRKEFYIKHKQTIHDTHPILHGRVDRYQISEKGLKYIEGVNK